MGQNDIDVEVLAGERRAENVEPIAVEPVEAVFRGKPHVASTVLADVLHAVVGQSVSYIVPPVGIDRRSGKGCCQEQDQKRYVGLRHRKNVGLMAQDTEKYPVSGISDCLPCQREGGTFAGNPAVSPVSFAIRSSVRMEA